jgi:hypothetical protein
MDNITKHLAATAVHKRSSGEPITNEEIQAGITVLRQVVSLLALLGDRYGLMTSDLNRILLDFEDFKESRKRAKTW